MHRNGAPLRAPPPKMRELKSVPELETPVNPYKSIGLNSNIVRAVEPQDVYDDRPKTAMGSRSNSNLSQQSTYYDDSYEDRYGTIKASQYAYPQAPPPRQISDASTAVSGSENWETYDDNSEPEPDASDAYYAKLRATRGKRMEPEYGHRPTSSQSKRARGIPPPIGCKGPVMIDEYGNRIVSGSEWTDEDMF